MAKKTPKKTVKATKTVKTIKVPEKLEAPVPSQLSEPAAAIPEELKSVGGMPDQPAIAEPAPPAKAKSEGRIYSVIGLICAIISLLFIPVLFGPVAIILGIVAKKKGDSTFGLVVIVLGAVFMVIGMLLGALISLLLGSYI